MTTFVRSAPRFLVSETIRPLGAQRNTAASSSVEIIEISSSLNDRNLRVSCRRRCQRRASGASRISILKGSGSGVLEGVEVAVVTSAVVKTVDASVIVVVVPAPPEVLVVRVTVVVVRPPPEVLIVPLIVVDDPTLTVVVVS